MSAEDDVREASERFYAALNQMANGDAGPMAGIWSHSAAATTMHPIGGREVGWDKVEGPWREVAKLASDGQIKLIDRIVHVEGGMGFEVGTEKGQMTFAGHRVPIEHRVTNIYRREAEGWKIVHHHADVSQPMLDALSRLKGKK